MDTRSVTGLVLAIVVAALAVAAIFRARSGRSRPIVLRRAGDRCPTCRGLGWVHDTGDWLPVLIFGFLGFFMRRKEICPTCGGTGMIV